jgi:carbohydrate kinase (thermoresistant glucokinase family)
MVTTCIPQSNLAKMAAAMPLTDEDRRPWLTAIGAMLGEARLPGLVVASSALKRRYRDTIRAGAPTVVFIHLEGSRELLTSRLEGRSGHFMPVTLLDSQLNALERLEPDEPGCVVDIGAPVSTILTKSIDAALSSARSCPSAPSD